MKLGFIKNLWGGKPKGPPRLVAIAPPRREERSLREWRTCSTSSPSPTPSP